MLSIKLGSAMQNNNKPCIVEIPAKVTKSVVRNVAFNLRDRIKQNPGIGIGIAYDRLNEDVENAVPHEACDAFISRLEALKEANIVTLEEILDPRELVKGYTCNFAVLFSDAGFTWEGDHDIFTVNDNAIFELPVNLELTSSNSYLTLSTTENDTVHKSYKKVVIPIDWSLIGSSLEEPVDDTLITTNSGVPTAVDSSVITKVEFADIDHTAYKFTCATPSAEYHFKLKMTLDMSKAQLFEETDSKTSVPETDPVISSWKASNVFEIIVPTTVNPE